MNVSIKVKEGTENKGAIESVVRVIRKTVSALKKRCSQPLTKTFSF
jgi:hypothetical protein